MKTCWDILGIAPTTELEVIRQTYLALLPSFHPENDPQGFKQLRQAYEEAQRWAQFPVDEAETDEVYEEHEMRVAFRALLASESERFQPSAWQQFIQRLNLCSMEEVDKLRWPLCDIAMETETISMSCLSLLAQRLNWQSQEEDDEAKAAELEEYLDNIKRGDVFDLVSLAALPAAVQDETIAYFFELDHIWRFYPTHFSDALQLHGAWVIPDDERLHRKLLRWFSSQQWGIVELITIARCWQQTEPDNEDAQYYLCQQRLLCGEGESLLADLCLFWQTWPSTQADELLLRWCRQHRPDYFPLVVMVVEARCIGEMKYVPGESARTRLLWAESLHSNTLSPLARSFVESMFYKRKAMAWANSRLNTQGEPETPLLDLYRTAEQVALEAFPKGKPFFRLLIRLEAGEASPLEALITQMLSSKVTMEKGDIRDKEELKEEMLEKQKKRESLIQKQKVDSTQPELAIHRESTTPRKPPSKAMKIAKIIGFIALVICALNRHFHFF
ncbi:J domain-containing protein [Salmonella enterica subsp. enterica]|nr:J domain-containing protein [Salmonella enterica subsp. enterica]